MENLNINTRQDSWVYPEFYTDAVRYFEYLKTINSNRIKEVLVWTNEFRIAEIPTINGTSFNFKMEMPRIRGFDEVINK
jgi:hypothetical protein